MDAAINLTYWEFKFSLSLGGVGLSPFEGFLCEPGGCHCPRLRQNPQYSPPPVFKSTLDCLKFVKMTAIAYRQKIAGSLKILRIYKTSIFYKRQVITSIVLYQHLYYTILNNLSVQLAEVFIMDML